MSFEQQLFETAKGVIRVRFEFAPRIPAEVDLFYNDLFEDPDEPMGPVFLPLTDVALDELNQKIPVTYRGKVFDVRRSSFFTLKAGLDTHGIEYEVLKNEFETDDNPQPTDLETM